MTAENLCQGGAGCKVEDEMEVDFESEPNLKLSLNYCVEFTSCVAAVGE